MGSLACHGCTEQPFTYVLVLKEVGNNSPAAIPVPDLEAMPSLDCRWDAPGHKGQGSLKPGHPSSTPSCLMRSTWTQVQVPGLQLIHISKQWGSIKCNAGEFEDVLFPEKRLLPDGCGVNYILNCDPLDSGRPAFLRASAVFFCTPPSHVQY